MKKLIIFLILIMAMPVFGETLSASGEADGFTIYYKEASIVDFLGIDWSDAYCKTVSGTTFDIQLSELKIEAGKTYVFKVNPYNAVGEAPDSNGVEWTPTVYVPPEDNLPVNAELQPVVLTIKDDEGNVIAP